MTKGRFLGMAFPFALALSVGTARAQVTDVVLGGAVTAATASCPVLATAQTSFSSSVSQVWFVVSYTGGTAGDVFTVQWLEPNGTQYSASTFAQPVSGGAYCFSYSLPVAGNTPYSLPGIWTVKLLENGLRIAQTQFTIVAVEPDIVITPLTVYVTMTVTCASSTSCTDGTPTISPSSVSIASTGQALNYAISSAAYDQSGNPVTNWLNLSSTAQGTLPIAVTPSLLQEGQALVTVSAAGAANSPAHFFVVARLVAGGILHAQGAEPDLPPPTVTQPILSFPAKSGLSQQIGVEPPAGSSATSVVTTVSYDTAGSASAARGWLSVAATSPFGLVTVTVNPNGLVQGGTYLGTIVFTLNCANGQASCSATSATVPVAYTVAPLNATVSSSAQSVLSLVGSMAQVASGGGWDTSLTLVNLDTAAGEARLNLSADNGAAPQLPFTFPQQTSAVTVLGSTLDENFGPGATLIVDTTGPTSQATTEGFAQLLASGDTNGFAIFTYLPSGQAAVAPLETRNASSYLLAFDDTGSLATGVAVANLAAAAANVNVVIRNDSGVQIGTGSISLPVQGHTSFMLTDPTSGFRSTVGVRGTVEFDAPPSGQISVLGLRANPIPSSSGSALTSLPVFADVAPGGGAMAQIVSGGGWQTTLTLVNTSSAAATAKVSFFGDDGSALSLPLSFPQTGTLSTATSVSQSIPAGGSLVILVEDSGRPASTAGSAVLSTTGDIGGFAIFRYNPTGQEAAVPLQAVNAPAYFLAFDNTGSLSTGLAIANVASQPALVGVIIRDDTGAPIGGGTISLPANGHKSFMLTDTSSGGWAVTAGVRGTLEFDTPYGGQIAPLGLRVATIPGGFTITTVPVMEP
jgi:hypothetical protein